MTEDSKKNQTEINPDQSDFDDTIIDVEVIETNETDNQNTATQTIAQQKPPSRTPWGWITALMLAAFIGGLFSAQYAKEGLITIGLMEPTVSSSADNSAADLSQIETTLTALSTDIKTLQNNNAQYENTLEAILNTQNALGLDIAALKSKPEEAGVAIDGDALASIKRDIETLSNDLTRIANIKNDNQPSVSRLQSAVAVTNAETDALKQKIIELEAALNSVASNNIEASPQGRLVLLLSRMKDKASTGLSFKNDINSLRADIINLPALDQQIIGAELAKLEETDGLITPFDTLLRSFEPVARSIMQAQEKSDGSFLTSLFTVRRRSADATGIEGILYNAETRLVARDIEGAIALLEALEGPARETAQTWTSNAKRHVDTINALDRMLVRISNVNIITAGDQQ
ncbi:COG4223 family protein [Kordiimonas sp. SCSIO 12610]|uniref:COG4223 family protein n=1 Tax=Kordiimonas sp. SCSIO 12610 TaxID=2829597 RepID=UPI00210BDCE3|nr:hypothetical protein [Kordiimonas sp. SCSIO 12610]UTW55303.1 hypothetical protein KFF44_16085 [Kordiimonas sp. SCSIO 12610]